MRVRERRLKRAVNRLPRGEALRHNLRLPGATVRFEVASRSARGDRQRWRIVAMKKSGQLRFYDDSGATRFHRARVALENVDVCTRAGQGDPRAQSPNRT